MTTERGELAARLERYEVSAQRAPLLYRLRVAAFASLAHFVYAALVSALLLTLLGIATLVVIHPSVLTVQLAIKGGGPLLLVFIAALRALRVHLTILPGHRLTRQEVPALFALLDGTAKKLAVPCPELVMLDDDYNAGVMERPRWGIFGREIELRLGMPLLQVVSKSELEAILAHELSHVAARDGQFSGWVYRMVLRFENLTKMNSHPPPLTRFLHWYLPRLEALTLPLRRRQEYAADKRAAGAVGSRVMADALLRMSLHEAELDDLWEQVEQAVVATPYPPANVFAVWGSQERSGGPALRSLAAIMKVEPKLGNSHPSLRERLRALGEAAELPAPVERHAAAALFGERYAALVEQAGWVWSSKVHERWKRKHEQLQLAKAELAQLEEIRQTEKLTEEQALTYAVLFERVVPDQDPVALYRAVLELFPKNEQARLAAGRILARRGDSAAVEMLEPLLGSADPGVRLYASGFLAALHRANEDEAALARAKEAFQRAGSELDHRAKEAAVFREADTYVAHGLPEILVDHVKRHLDRFVQLRRVYLVRKVIAEDLTRLLLLYEAEGVLDHEVRSFERDLAGPLQLPEPLVLMSARASTELAKRVRTSPGSLIFTFDPADLHR